MDDEIFADFQAMAERAIAKFLVLPCAGDRDGIVLCDAEKFESKCAERMAGGCPRNILAYEQQEAQRIAADRVAATGVPRRFATIATGKLDDTAAMAIVRSWLPSGKRTLLLAGSVGVGKSIAAAWALTVSRGMWIPASELARVAIEEKPLMARLRDCPLLVMDDLGTDAPDKSGWSAAQMQALLCLRDDEGLRTLATTNLTHEQFRKAYGDRVFDRFKAGEMVGLGGKSLRGAK